MYFGKIQRIYNRLSVRNLEKVINKWNKYFLSDPRLIKMSQRFLLHSESISEYLSRERGMGKNGENIENEEGRLYIQLSSFIFFLPTRYIVPYLWVGTWKRQRNLIRI